MCFQTKYALDKHMQNIHPRHEAYKCNMIVFMYCLCCIYCKSTKFGALLFLANLANCANICCAKIRDLTLIVHCVDGETPNLIATKSLCFEKRQILQLPKFVYLQYPLYWQTWQF